MYTHTSSYIYTLTGLHGRARAHTHIFMHTRLYFVCINNVMDKIKFPNKLNTFHDGRSRWELVINLQKYNLNNVL